jgi:hypothetical protein
VTNSGYVTTNAATPKETSLEHSLAALKSLLSDYVLRTRQAEAVASRLMSQNLTDAQVHVLATTISQQIDVRTTERSVQQQALIQATVVALNAALQTEGEQQKELLTSILRNLTTAVTTLNLPKVQTPSK